MGLLHTCGQREVMLSPGLAELYHLETRALVQAMKRNLDRFPEDFMFQMTDAVQVAAEAQAPHRLQYRLGAVPIAASHASGYSPDLPS